MTTLKFKCTLLTDVILNSKSASEGQNTTLDFIPGNTFLGIVASSYDGFGKDALEVFHSGKVRFGDAHLANWGSRTLHVAASFFVPKIKGSSVKVYNHHLIDVSSDEMRRLQLKQMRKGFYDYTKSDPVSIPTNTHFAIKSAYDREHRRAADAQMFGYESLGKGHEYYFSIEVDNDSLCEKITASLIGEKRIGRSRSAQYGLIKIEPACFDEVTSTGGPFNDNLYTVYADGRLIFFDKYGLPTFTPSEEDLGFEAGDAKIVWEYSQIRTFQYAPYNWKRKSFDADRCGIEKGSVFVVRASSSPSESKYVGAYQNEGFGRVIYNPEFLKKESYEETKNLENEQKKDLTPTPSKDEAANKIINYLAEKRRKEEAIAKIYTMVNKWSEDNGNSFYGGQEQFSSQWGKIRSLAESNRRKSYGELVEEIKDYLGHGVAKKRWDAKGRSKKLISFMDESHESVLGYEWMALSLLSSIMAKQ